MEQFKKFIWKSKDLIKELEKYDIETLVECKKYSENRTIQQNKYLHAIFTFIWEEEWYSKDAIKRRFKNIFLKEYYEMDWIVDTEIKSTSKLNKKEINEFIKNIDQRVFERLWFNIPDPDSKNIYEFYKQYL